MLSSKQGKIVIGMLVLAVIVVAAVVVLVKVNPAIAQGPPPPPVPQMGPQQPGPMGQEPVIPQGNVRLQPPMAPGMVPGGIGGPAAITASGEYVYVVQGNTLYQFSAKTLKQVNKADLVPPPPANGDASQP